MEGIFLANGEEVRKVKWYWIGLLCLAGLAVNFAGSAFAEALELPFYFDAIGTVLAAALGGYLPGIVVGLSTNFLKMVSDETALYYGSLNVLIAVCISFFLSGRSIYRMRSLTSRDV